MINTENIVAEYIVPEISDVIERNILIDTFKEHKDEKFTDIKHINTFNFSYNNINNDNQVNNTMTNAAELQIREEMDKEKFLVNEIINQLSNSLKSNSKENEINEKYEQFKEILYDTSPSSTISTDNNMSYNIKDKFSLKIKVRKRFITRRKNFCQNNNIKIPLISVYDPSDSIISKSPNFLSNKSIEMEQKYLSPKISNKELKFKTFTPCMTKNRSFRSEEFNLGKEVARSTPRRKKRFYRQYSSLRKLRKNNKFISSDNTSPDATNSLSPNQSCVKDLDYKFNKNLAIKLHENKYDEDMPISSKKNEVNVKTCISQKNLIEELNNNFRTLNIKKIDFNKKNKEHLKEYILQEKFSDKEVELKVNNTINTLNTYKENLNTFLSR